MADDATKSMEEELAGTVLDAVHALNAAMQAASGHGLTVSARVVEQISPSRPRVVVTITRQVASSEIRGHSFTFSPIAARNSADLEALAAGMTDARRHGRL